MFAWENKVRAYKLDPERGRVVDSFKIKDIIAEPNRFQVEAIIQAMGLAISELIRLEEQRIERMSKLLEAKDERVRE